MPAPPRQPRNQSLVRGIGLLRAIAARSPGASVAELAESVDIPRTTASRLLATLEELGVAERLPRSRRWIVGAEVARLGRAADPFATVRERAHPLLEPIAAKVRESAMIGVVHGNWDTEIVIQVDAPNLVGTTNWLGQRHAGALHASALGKLALATLPDAQILARFGSEYPSFTPATITSAEALIKHLHLVREQGYAATNDEVETGLTALAVAIDDEHTLQFSSAHVLGVSVSGPSARITPDRYGEIVDLLVRCAATLASHRQASNAHRP
jgi:DNA-binding IclR family transcriptional regulator